MPIQIKCFVEEDILELEEVVNEWFLDMQDIVLLDCKYDAIATVCDKEWEDEMIYEETISYSCCIIYRINNIV